MDIDKLVENYFAPKEKDLLTKGALWELFEEVVYESNSGLKEEKTKANPITEQSGGRFSYSIAIPKLVPTEAWGDPANQSREEIDKVFSVVRGGADIQARIADINKFLSPESAKRKTSANVILNMMMIVEALQATLNDYNESAAGFVFEGFMAALTGGKQIAGRIRGTLPIEDFGKFEIAWSRYYNRR